MKKSRFLSLIAIILVLICLCSCGADAVNITPFVMPKEVKKVSSGSVAENDNYSLLWDSDSSCVILHNKKNGEIWSSIPYDYYNYTVEHDGYKDLNFASPIYLVCRNRDKGQSTEHFSEYLSADNAVYSLKLKNGLRVIYLFEEIGVSVPVEYRLIENGLETRVLVNEIGEKENLVYKISVMPFFASAKNGDGSYLFVPSGSGAIMYTDDERNTRKYSEPVYGKDETFQPLEELSVHEKVNLPVFGVKRNDTSAMLGIIEKGSELGVIEANAGDKQLGYSAVYPSFQIRNISETTMRGSQNSSSIVTKVTPYKPDIDYVSVKYIPLYGEDADYNGMAKTYRDYLSEKGYLKEKETKSGVFLNLIGGINVKQSFLGVPYTKVLPATTFEQAEKIVKDISAETDLDLVLKLTGFGKGGIDSSLLGGNFKLDSSVGNKKSLQDLHNICKAENIPLLMNYDLIFYRKSSNGYSLKHDCALNAHGLSVKYKRYGIVTHQEEYKNENYSLLNREYLLEISDKMLKKTAKYSFDGISLSSLGSIAYGDGKNKSYIAKNGIYSDVEKIFKSIKKQNKTVASQNPNLYAALSSDYIYSSPTSSSDYLYFDMNIPFYQMIFKGYIPLSSASINLSNDVRGEFLKAMATGSSLEFTVSYNFYNEFINTMHSGLAATEYKGIKQNIVKMCEESEKLLNAVKGANILEYSRKGNISSTEFSNGVKIFVNYGNSVGKCEIGDIEPFGFIFTGGEG